MAAAALLLFAVVVHVDASRAPACRAGVVRATASDGTTIARAWSGSDVALPDGSWRIAIAADGCWAAETTSEMPSVVLRPAKTIRFAASEAATLRFSAVDGSIAPTNADCTRDAMRFACVVPAMPLDLRIAADGFVPHYVWSTTATDLGDIHFVRGASVSGRLTIPEKKPKLAGASVKLMPASFAAFGAQPPRDTLATLAVRTNDRGFFQFAGVEEGTYVVIAQRDGWSAARVDDVRVVSGAEVALEKPIALTPLAKIDVAIDPPTDAGGRPWRIRLQPTTAENARAETIDRPASITGEWSAAHVAAGAYALAVTDTSGTSTMHREFLDIRDGMPPLRIAIDSVRVRGKVTFRGEPVAALVTMTKPVNATAQVRFRTAADGTFAAVLPEEGKWRVQVVAGGSNSYPPDVAVHRRDDGQPVTLDFALPPGRIRGTTVDENGNAIPATVLVQRDGRYVASAAASDGTFDLIGLEPADVQLRATSTRTDRDSGNLPLRVSEAADDPVTITLPKRVKANAWVGTADGRPIAGAMVRYLTGGRVREEVTGPSGELTLSLPANETSVAVVIVAHDFATKMMLLPIGDDTVEVTLSPIGARILFRDLIGRLPFIVHGGTAMNGTFLLEPSEPGVRPRALTSEGLRVDVEPGTYLLCPAAPPAGCRTAVLEAGSTTIFDVKELLK